MLIRKSKTPTESVAERFANALSRPKHLLLVDDSADFIAAFEKMLQGYNAEVYTADSLDKARTVVEAVLFDAVILDCLLTNGHGVELYREIMAEKPELPVVFLTAASAINERARIETVGPARCHSKMRLFEPGFLDSLLLQLGVSRKNAQLAAAV